MKDQEQDIQVQKNSEDKIIEALKNDLLQHYLSFEERAKQLLGDELKTRYQIRQEIAELYIREVDSKIAGYLVENKGQICFQIPDSFNPLLSTLTEEEAIEKAREIKKTLDDFLSLEIQQRVSKSTKEDKHPFERLDQEGRMINGLGVVEGNYPLHLNSLDRDSVHRLITADTSIMTHGSSDDEKFVFVSIMDVSGKLINGGDYLGLLTKLYATALLHSSSYRQASDVLAPDEFFDKMNNIIGSRFRYEEYSDRFVTSTAVLIDNKGQSFFGDAGGMHPIHLHYDPETGKYSATLLDKLEKIQPESDLPLGVMADEHYSKSAPVRIEKNDFLVLYTDGVTESFIPLDIVERLGIKYHETVTDESGKEHEQEITPKVSYFVEVNNEDISKMKQYVLASAMSEFLTSFVNILGETISYTSPAFVCLRSLNSFSVLRGLLHNKLRSLEKDLLRYQGTDQLVMKERDAKHAGLDVSRRNKLGYVELENEGLLRVLENCSVNNPDNFKANVEKFFISSKTIHSDEARIVYIMRNE